MCSNFTKSKFQATLLFCHFQDASQNVCMISRAVFPSGVAKLRNIILFKLNMILPAKATMLRLATNLQLLPCSPKFVSQRNLVPLADQKKQRLENFKIAASGNIGPARVPQDSSSNPLSVQVSVSGHRSKRIRLQLQVHTTNASHQTHAVVDRNRVPP